MLIRIRLDEGSVERARARLRRKLESGMRSMTARLTGDTEAAARGAVRRSPTATGQSAGSYHATAEQKGPQHIRRGVASSRLPNGQNVIMEQAGEMAMIHTSVDEHDQGEGLCSSSFPGGWKNDPESNVNVREMMGGSVQANAQAMVKPMGKALAEVFGPMVDLSAGKGFVKEAVNHYPGSGGRAEYRERLERAGREGLNKG